MAIYADYIMEMMRKKLGLSPDDTSRDDEIYKELSNGEKMSKSSVNEFDKDKFWSKE